MSGSPVDDVLAAAARIHGVVHRTPVLRSRTLDRLVGAEGGAYHAATR
jgi:threonine dehydratase